MIINIRGTSGSGKSTVVFTLLKNFPHEELKNSKGKIMAYKVDAGLKKPIYVIGSYHTPAGGLDGVPTQIEAGERALWAHEEGGHVIMEGLLASGAGPKGMVTIMLSGLGNQNACFAFMDTPLEVCLDRVRQRRLARGDDRPFNTANTESKHKQVARTYDQLIEVGYNAVWLNYEKAYEQVMGIFKASDND